MSAAIVAFGAVSALGVGDGAASAGEVGEAARVGIARDEELAASGLTKPFAARVDLGQGPDATDRATRILARSFEACARSLDASRPGWRALRVGLAIGTSSGGMRTAEELFARVANQPIPPPLPCEQGRGAERVGDSPPCSQGGAGGGLDAALAARAAYFGPLLDVVANAGLSFAPASLVLSACASSAVAIGLASRWLEAGECDVALAGGFDALSVFVGAGFESLRATSAAIPPRPFRVGRDGMALGEGGAVLALVRAADATTSLGYVRGFGASADAVHLTAPDRQGAGVLRAARAALAEAGDPRVDLVSAHATATPFNDAAEARVLAEVGPSAPVHAFKAQVGHTLGAAAALESLVAFDAMARGVLPATAGEGAIDPEAPANLLARAERGQPRTALKLASAFGGANAALVLSPAPGPATSRPVRAAWITRAARVSSMPRLDALAGALGVPADRLARLDRHALWGLAAVHALAERTGREALAGAGIVVGTAAATLETNAVFAAALRERGARFVPPRLFPYTSPNAVAGECGIVFGLTGPSLAVGAGLEAGLEALAVGATLVRAGDCDRIVVVAVDDVGDVTRAWARAIGAELAAGAVALLVTCDRTPHAVARIAGARLALGPSGEIPAPPRGPAGHLVLAPLDSDEPPDHLEGASSVLGTSAVARVDFAAN